MTNSSLLDKFNYRLYYGLIRRNTVFLSTLLVGAIAFELVFDGISDRVFRKLNRGVSTIYQQSQDQIDVYEQNDLWKK